MTITAKQKVRVVRLASSQVDDLTICAKTGLSLYMVQKIRREAGVFHRTSHRERIIKLLKKGLSNVEICSVLKCHNDTVQKYRRLYGIQKSARTKTRRMNSRQIVAELTQLGESITNIALRTGLSPSTVKVYRHTNKKKMESVHV